MILSHRPVRPEDIPRCVEIIANHPVVGPRYGEAIEQLPTVLTGLIANEAYVAHVILDGRAEDSPICWVGTSAFVRDDFLEDLKKPPHFWVSAELTKRIAAGRSPLLTSTSSG